MGAMVGSALGDAIGEIAFMLPQEKILRSELKRISELRYTDDTAMALGIAESIIERGCIDEQHLGKAFSDNFDREPWRGYASGPPTVFYQAEKLGIAYSQAAQNLFGGSGSLGNGGAMRIVPVGLFFHNAPDLYKQACASARVTHTHPVGMDGASVQASAVARAVKIAKGELFSKGIFARDLVECARTNEIREKMRIVEQSVAQKVSPGAVADRIGRTVAVHESMPFAVYSFLRHHESFEGCIFCAIMNGGDRDTLGAMAGAISGAFLGLEAIPQSWRLKLENRGYIEKLASELAKLVAV